MRELTFADDLEIEIRQTFDDDALAYIMVALFQLARSDERFQDRNDIEIEQMPEIGVGCVSVHFIPTDNYNLDALTVVLALDDDVLCLMLAKNGNELTGSDIEILQKRYAGLQNAEQRSATPWPKP